MTQRVKNILFIMSDQLRADHLSCYGHPKLQTPHLDGLAKRGVIFDNAYVQSPVCGPSRMSYYTGRYMQSHGVSWNFVPLKAGEMTLGDHLRPLGVRSVLIGKTHMRGDASGMSRLGTVVVTSGQRLMLRTSCIGSASAPTPARTMPCSASRRARRSRKRSG